MNDEMFRLSLIDITNNDLLNDFVNNIFGYDFDFDNEEYVYIQYKIVSKNIVLNIYADEILFLCKINPLKKCNLLSEKDCSNIIKYTKEVLEKAIKLGGTTIRTYSSVDGVHGLFQNELLIHGKDKGTCPNCNNKIEKIRIGGRGTYYCPRCQK